MSHRFLPLTKRLGKAWQRCQRFEVVDGDRGVLIVLLG